MRVYPPLDLSRFEALLEEANVCYSLDLVYGVNMVKIASNIQKKRDRWALRLEYRALAGDNEPWIKGWDIADVMAVLREHDTR